MFDKFFKKKKTSPTLTQEEQLNYLKGYLGKSISHVDVTVPMTYNEVLGYFGEQCDDYEPLCGCCCAWIEWHKTKKVTVSVSRESILKSLYE